MVVVLTIGTWVGTGGTAYAQNDPNPGALTFTGGFDLPTLYFFRGIRQESDAALTMWPFGDLGIALHSGDGGIKSVSVNFGMWNSAHTEPGSWYEADYYGTLGLGLGGGTALGMTYTSYTSPDDLFTHVKELSFKFTVDDSGAFGPLNHTCGVGSVKYSPRKVATALRFHLIEASIVAT